MDRIRSLASTTGLGGQLSCPMPCGWKTAEPGVKHQPISPQSQDLSAMPHCLGRIYVNRKPLILHPIYRTELVTKIMIPLSLVCSEPNQAHKGPTRTTILLTGDRLQGKINSTSMLSVFSRCQAMRKFLSKIIFNFFLFIEVMHSGNMSRKI